MIRRTKIIHEYNFYTEALPITLMGILLNVAGRQIAAVYNDPIFGDMVGTAFTAIVLGPWWAAAAAAATTVVNGTFSEIYFPFGVVNVAGGLVWGYLARAADLRSRVFTLQPGRLIEGLLWTIALWLAGAVATGLASTGVKLVIFPPMGRPLVLGDVFVATQAHLEALLGTGNVPPALALAAGDLLRDLLDKAVVVSVAVVLVAFSRVGPTLGEGSRGASAGQRMRTDILSIFIFACFYSAFILLAQMLRPTIKYPGAEQAIAWLSNPGIVLMLYAPLIAAGLALVLGTFRASDEFARGVHRLRELRRYVFRNIFAASHRGGALLRSLGVQPLGLGVSLWSLRGVFDARFGVPLALVAIVAALVIYLIAARIAFPRLRRAVADTSAVHRWLEIDSPPGAGRDLLLLVRDLFSDYFSRAGSELSRRSNLLYSLGFVASRPSGPLEDMLFGKRESLFFERVALLGLVEEPRALTPSLGRELEGLVTESGAQLAAILSTTPLVADPAIAQSLRQIKQKGADVLLLDWTDVSSAIAGRALGAPPQTAVQQARVRFLQALHPADTKVSAEFSSRPEWLAGRALPSLRFVIDRLPKRSRVFDLGCGYGRHTFAAVQAGHDVVAIDRKPTVCESLKSDLAALSVDSGRVSVMQGDFVHVSSDALGLADLVIVTGVLQHARDEPELRQRLGHLAALAGHPTSLIYVEMLFDILFDGAPPGDGRIDISQGDFETILRECFPASAWRIEQTRGALRQRQSFDAGGRSFEPPARTIESTAVEYLLQRSD
jgi:SAM-dependent methyltransferase